MINIRTLIVGAVAACSLAGCAKNWTYDVKSMHHDQLTGRHYVVCKSEFSETFIQVDVTPEVYNLIKVDTTCPAPMSIPPPTPMTGMTGASSPSP